jgi:hypothetical protein
MKTHAEKSVAERRAENLKAMRSPASFVLAGIVSFAVLTAFVFYDHPITDNPILLSYLQGLSGRIN